MSYPNRPSNHSETLPFHDLFLTLFNPLNENKKEPTGRRIARRKQGPHGPSNLSPHEIRQNIIERFISRWRKEVGDDIYPAFRLILPEKDRDRTMYGLKEKTIGKLLIKVMKINKDSEDGYNLVNWRQPGQSSASRTAGDFAGRCFEVIRKRPVRTDVGNLSIGQVNELLDRLSAAQKEDTQLPIFEDFYKKMNPDELMWVIRVILRQMKVGATEKTFFNIWHPDAESLFNISSNLRRVCWELHDQSIRLEDDDRGITLMQCFQPQLAQFQMPSIPKMVERMRATEEDPVFWIEEKLDGERMQLHMICDKDVAGGRRFAFWSRKAKDYTYLYGNGFLDENGALTRHIHNAFHEGVENLILDGEMITWDPEEDAMVPFGTLKTAALNLQKDQNSKGQRPLFRVFDILYLNGQALANYTLRDRRRALEASISTVPRWMEVHTYSEATTSSEVEASLLKIVLEGSEGLVLKNPRSPYRLNERNDDWMKVKPEYMTEFGESLDCIVVGGYYGSGHRGGRLSSFMCGLRVDENDIQNGANPMKCHSFFKVGGGFTADDYASIRHHTDGKWKVWNPKRPPVDFLELAGGPLQHERPDVWIRPDESVVLSVKAASITETDKFKALLTLRFPRFKQLRLDRDWTTALSVSGFKELQKKVEKEHSAKQFKIDDSRKRRQKASRKRPLTIAGTNTTLDTAYGGPKTKVFENLNFYVMGDCLSPEKKSKTELEDLIKANGGKIFQMYNTEHAMICIGDRRTVKVASLMKRGEIDIVRPSWILACVRQSESDIGKTNLLLPLEPRHMFFTTQDSKIKIEDSTDEYGDSFARDVDMDEIQEILDSMPKRFEHALTTTEFRTNLDDHNHDLDLLPGSMFEGLLLYIAGSEHDSLKITSSSELETYKGSAIRLKQVCNTAKFAGARFTNSFVDDGITHVLAGTDPTPGALREKFSLYVAYLDVTTHSLSVLLIREGRRKPLPRIVSLDWIEQSWIERTLLNEEREDPATSSH
ncbi:DNA ligase (ATP) [Pseudocyphellaria aurata]|nr:DNA ligase (ATP) [Pseudocyphellaria aurata]